MTSLDVAVAVIDALEALAVPYLLVGSFSTNYYGIARSTRDVDIVVELGERSLREVVDHLGPPFVLDPQMTFENVTMTTRNVIHFGDQEFKIELFHLSDEPHDRERFRRRCRLEFLGRSVWLPTAEDVIVTKLRWALIGKRGKDRSDAQDVIAVQNPRLDWEYIHHWCEQHGTRALLDEIRQSIPPLPPT
jgi:hypothetical protein